MYSIIVQVHTTWYLVHVLIGGGCACLGRTSTSCKEGESMYKYLVGGRTEMIGCGSFLLDSYRSASTQVLKQRCRTEVLVYLYLDLVVRAYRSSRQVLVQVHTLVTTLSAGGPGSQKRLGLCNFVTGQKLSCIFILVPISDVLWPFKILSAILQVHVSGTVVACSPSRMYRTMTAPTDANPKRRVRGTRSTRYYYVLQVLGKRNLTRSSTCTCTKYLYHGSDSQ
jgi:hypothetical protein